MKVIIEINIESSELKQVIAQGWNNRFHEDLTGDDINSYDNVEDIICAIPYIETEKISHKVII